MEYLFIYLLQIAENLRLVFAAALGMVVISGVFWALMVINEDTLSKECRKICIWSIAIVMVCLCIPNKQTLLLMGGTYLGKKAVTQIVQSEKLQKVSEIIDLKLDKLIKENQ